MGRTLRRLAHQSCRVQGELRHRVAKHIVVPLHELLVEVFHREIRVLVPVEAKHPLKLFLRYPLRRAPTHSTVDKAIVTLSLKANRPTLKRPNADPQHL